MQTYMSSPESPMNLGSPTSGPSAASISVANAANAAVSPSTHYLPGYLLGDYPSIGHSPSVNASRSWLGHPHSSGSLGSPPKALHLSSTQFSSPHLQHPSSSSSGGGGGRSPGRLTGMQLLPSPSVVGRKDYKPGAPPTTGLFDHIQTSPPPSAAPSNAAASSSLRLDSGDSLYGAESSFSGATMGLEGEEFWITVFGFPPAAASYILQQFSQFGNILKHVIAPNGNWMHLQYQSKIQAQKALSKNGRVFGNNIMVGVSECNDQNIASGSISALQMDPGANGSFSSPCLVNSSSLTLGGASQANNSLSTSRIRAMRPLTSSSVLNSSVRDDRDVVNDASNPKKSSGLISKTVDYLFGW